MHSFSCNAKGTTGYTVATHGHSVAMIHAHGCDDDAKFYVEMDASFPRAFIAHMPLDDGEYVTEICRRYALGPLDRPSVCLVVRTLPLYDDKLIKPNHRSSLRTKAGIPCLEPVVHQTHAEHLTKSWHPHLMGQKFITTHVTLC